MGEKHTGCEFVGTPVTLGTGSLVYSHWIIDPKRFKLPAANFPSEGFEGLFQTLDFDWNTDESAYVTEHVPFRWKSGTDIEVKVDWLHDSVDAGVVVWGIEWKVITPDDVVVGAGTTITQASAGNHVAGQMQRTAFAFPIDISGATPDDVVAIRFFRDADAGADTLAEDARLLNVHFHFTQDKFGEAV